MKKGISTIIAAIILVVITIGLIATAYLYFAGIVSVGPVLAIASARCSSNVISVTIRNDGTSNLDCSTDIDWLIDGATATAMGTTCDNTALVPGSVEVCSFDKTTSGVYDVKAIGPRNQAGGPVTC